MRDAIASLRWISDLHSKHSPDAAPVILWGTSIGAGFASGLAANEKAHPDNLHIVSLCLETPFTSIRDMLVALYPQKWVPYKHLWPFLWNHLDNYGNLMALAENCRVNRARCPNVFLLNAGRDEIVPAEHGDRLYARCVDLGLNVERYNVAGAFHNDATWKPAGRQAIATTIASQARQAVAPLSDQSQT